MNKKSEKRFSPAENLQHYFVRRFGTSDPRQIIEEHAPAWVKVQWENGAMTTSEAINAAWAEVGEMRARASKMVAEKAEAKKKPTQSRAARFRRR
ncbi:MAG: hypothetical protein QXO69_01380 [archaeon]